VHLDLLGAFLLPTVCYALISSSSPSLTIHKGFAPSVAPLGALSFKLHKQLAEEYNGKEEWGYSRTTATSLGSGTKSAITRRGEDWLRDGASRADATGARDPFNDDGPAWLSRHIGSTVDTISADRSVAQV
jgi:hypothetical protein